MPRGKAEFSTMNEVKTERSGDYKSPNLSDRGDVILPKEWDEAFQGRKGKSPEELDPIKNIAKKGFNELSDSLSTKDFADDITDAPAPRGGLLNRMENLTQGPRDPSVPKVSPPSGSISSSPPPEDKCMAGKKLKTKGFVGNAVDKAKNVAPKAAGVLGISFLGSDVANRMQDARRRKEDRDKPQ